LPGSGRSLGARPGAVHPGGAQDVTTGRATANRRREALAEDGCRPAVRILGSTGRLGQGVPLYRLALQEEGQDPGNARAVSTLRQPGIPLSGVRHQPGTGHRPAGVVLQAAGRGREPDPGSPPRCRMGGASSGRWAPHCVHFQRVMLADNRNCWWLLFQREEGAQADQLQHATLATAGLRFLLVAAKIWQPAGRTGIRSRDQDQERGWLQRWRERLRNLAAGPGTFLPVLATPLECGVAHKNLCRSPPENTIT
jgi:hypothetical protein